MEVVIELKTLKANLNNLNAAISEVLKLMSELKTEGAMLKGRLSVLC